MSIVTHAVTLRGLRACERPPAIGRYRVARGGAGTEAKCAPAHNLVAPRCAGAGDVIANGAHAHHLVAPRWAGRGGKVAGCNLG